jgi:hypothetical protein
VKRLQKLMRIRATLAAVVLTASACDGLSFAQPATAGDEFKGGYPTPETVQKA